MEGVIIKFVHALQIGKKNRRINNLCLKCIFNNRKKKLDLYLDRMDSNLLNIITINYINHI
jgi:hypothetical protein